jgi:uncharacterized delta-60 repeat protein
MAVVGSAACSQILGLTAPHGQADGGSGSGGADFTIQITTGAPRVPQNGSDFLDVAITRSTGFDDPIMVDIPAPPAGVAVTPVTLDGSATSGALVLAGSAQLTVGADLAMELVATAGSVSHTADFNAIVTLQPGILDPTFGAGGGVETPNFGSAARFSGCNDISIASDGAITAVGGAENTTGAVGLIFRLTANGSSDPTFAAGPGVGSDAQLFAATHQSTGNIVAAGAAKDPTADLADASWLTSFDPNGAATANFGTSGDNDFVDSTQNYSIGSGEVVSVTALPDDELVELIALEDVGNPGVLVRQSSIGTPFEEAFGPVALGISIIDIPSAMAVDAGTGFTTYVAGTLAGSGSATSGVIVHILNSGSNDPSFGSSGIVDFGTGVALGAVTVQPDGNILVGGISTAFVERLQPDGSPDLGFGSGGSVTLTGPFSGITVTEITAMAVQTDGRIVVAATTMLAGNFGEMLLRLLPDGTLDPTYGTGGVVPISIFDAVGNMRLQPGNDAVVCGTAMGGGATIARVTF